MQSRQSSYEALHPNQNSLRRENRRLFRAGLPRFFYQKYFENYTERTDRARSETQVIANHPMRVHPLLEEDISRQMSSKRDKNLKKLKKHVSRIDALRMAFSSEKVDRWSAVDLELVNAVEVVQDGGPYQV